MQPTFRSDLTCSREEQQGVVFYRIDDPETKTSFRLYEIEYLIAQKLNGERDLGQIIEAVKGEYNFDITEADLQKFISQLESMGFVRGLGGVVEMAPLPIPMGEVDTQEMERPPTPLRRPPGTSQPLDLDFGMGSGEIDQAELARLLKAGFLHVKQGYLVQARDYLLAAKELSPSDRGLVRLVSNIEVMGDDAGPSEIERLWKQCRELYPDLADDIGPLDGGDDDASAAVAHQARNVNRAWAQDTSTRVRLSVVFVVLLVCGIGGLVWVAKALHVFEGTVKVKVQALQGARVPVFFPGAAVGVRPLEEGWVAFGVTGTVGPDVAKVGTRVAKGDVLASLVLPPKQMAQLKVGRDLIQKAQNDYAKVAKVLEKIVVDHHAAQADKQEAEDKIKELRPKSVLKQDPVARKELEKAKKEMVKANKRLTALAKRERGPRAAEAKAKKKIEAARLRLAALQTKLGDKLLRATLTGEVTELKIAPGEPARARAPAVHLQNSGTARLAFNVKDKAGLQTGGEAMVSIQRGSPVTAKVVAVQDIRGGTEVTLDLPDPTGSLVAMPADSFRLLKEFAEPAFKIRPKALLGDEQNPQVLVMQNGHVSRQSVRVLEGQAGDVVVYDPSGALRNDTQVVLERRDGQELGAFADGSAAEVEDAK